MGRVEDRVYNILEEFMTTIIDNYGLKIPFPNLRYMIPLILAAQWVDVKDGLPEDGYGWFWARIEYPDGVVEMKELWFNKDSIFKWWHKARVGDSLPERFVTHYMPVPPKFEPNVNTLDKVEGGE